MKKNSRHNLFDILHYKTFVLFSLILLPYGVFKVIDSYLLPNTKTIPPIDIESCRSSSLPFCNIQDDIQFKKFFLIALDGVSFEFLQPLLDVFGDHAQVYSTYTNLNRYTQSIFRTWFTGRDNINLQPFPIPEDTVMLSYSRTYGRKLFILGYPNFFTDASPYPFKEVFSGMDIFFDNTDMNEYRIFNTLLNEKNRIRLYNDLKIIEENGLSVLGYEGHSDEIQHEESSKSNILVQRLAEDIIPIKEWIDNHPDYVLIISSDHGHDEVLAEENPKPLSIPYIKEFVTESKFKYYYHGSNHLNNTGWWLYYSRFLSPSYRQMNVTDVGATWSKYLKNVDIPANSVGRPMNSMKYIRNEVKVKQQGLAQLWNLCRNSTTHCKGRVYEEGLKWEPGMVKEEKMKKEKGNKNEKKESYNEAKKEENVLLVKNMVSVKAEELFPYNLSVDELRRIAEGRDKNPKKKIIQNRTCLYYFEFDKDEDGNLYDNLKEKKEKLSISQENAIKILSKYDSFVKESEILHTLLYDFSLVFDKFFYINNSFKIKFCSNQILYISVILNVIVLFLFLRKGVCEFYRRIKSNLLDIKNTKLMKEIIFSLLIIILYICSKVIFSTFNRFNEIFEYFTRPTVHVLVFRDYKPFALIYGVIAKQLSLYLIILVCIYIMKLSLYFVVFMNKVRNRKIEGKNSESSENMNKSYILYFDFFVSKDVYNNYVFPILRCLIAAYLLPKIVEFLMKTHKFRVDEEKYHEYESIKTGFCFKAFRILYYITLIDIVLCFLKLFLDEGRKNFVDLYKEGEVKKKKSFFFSLAGKYIFCVICWNFMIWADPLKEKKYLKGFECNMILIVLLTIMYIPLEIMKKRREVEIDNTDLPSIFTGIREIKESWSILNGIKKCGAYTDFNFYIFIFLSLFLIDQSLHLKIAFVLIMFYTFILLPIVHILINKLYNFIELKKNEKEKSKTSSFELTLLNMKDNEHLCKGKLWNEIFLLTFNWVEIIHLILTFHQLVEYLTYSLFGWLFSVGEDSSFSFEFTSHWVGLENVGFSHLLSVLSLVVIKSGYMTVLTLCSAYIKSCIENVYKRKVIINSRKEEERKDKSLNISSSSVLDVSVCDDLKNEEVKELSFSERMFKAVFTDLFIPMILSSAFYTGSLYIGSYAGSMADIMKQMPFMIFTLNFSIGFVFTVIPLLI